MKKITQQTEQEGALITHSVIYEGKKYICLNCIKQHVLEMKLEIDRTFEKSYGCCVNTMIDALLERIE